MTYRMRPSPEDFDDDELVEIDARARVEIEPEPPPPKPNTVLPSGLIRVDPSQLRRPRTFAERLADARRKVAREVMAERRPEPRKLKPLSEILSGGRRKRRSQRSPRRRAGRSGFRKSRYGNDAALDTNHEQYYFK
jgi:hypothetical protein